MTYARRIAVWIDEPEVGQFFWVLHESLEGASVWANIARSEQPFATWIDALDAGTVALFKLIEDERIGPRRVES